MYLGYPPLLGIYIEHRDGATSRIPVVITFERTGRRGRPRKRVDSAFLRDVMDPRRNIYLSKLARKLNISRDVLQREIRLCGIDRGFTDISDAELDRMIHSFLLQREHTTGSRYVIGHIRSKGIKVPQCRIRASIKRVDRLGRFLRRNARQKVPRQSYHVPRPNALWHMDGHHKLIAWGIVIHGCVDGFSRTVG
jgi:hypothetical protein